ncbi:MAG: MBL fold metallo-hydrolase [Gemmatimonadota bacterium]|nr:MBL fold metallo-hydrolase [Gemmatimonadota bacterium]
MIEVLQIPVGPFQSNAYLVWEEAPGEGVIVDAGAEAERILGEASERGLEIVSILQTHAHGDHIAALPEVVDAPDAPVYLHPDAEPMLHDAQTNLSAFAGVPVTAPIEGYHAVEDGDTIEVLGRPVDVLHTPGHAPGSVCYHFVDDAIVFTGDALFAGSIGRTDFPGGSFETLTRGIREKLLTLPDETRAWPGHMGPTTIGRERRTNPFLQGERPGPIGLD